MKRLQTTFIAVTLAAAMLSTSAFFALIGSALGKAWVLKDSSFTIFLPLIPACLAFWGSSGAFLLAGLAFGLYTTFLYAKGRLFTVAMVRGLERVGLCFLGACLSFLLLAIYLAVNMQLAALFLLFFLLAALLAAAALFFFLLADAVDEGRRLREENDLTI